MGAGMLSAFDLGNNIPARHILPLTDIVMFIAAARPVILALNPRHSVLPRDRWKGLPD